MHAHAHTPVHPVLGTHCFATKFLLVEVILIFIAILLYEATDVTSKAIGLLMAS